MRKRRLTHPTKSGLSFVDANRGRLITMESDVLDIRNQIEERWPELRVFFDEWEETWVVVEHCGDGVQRLATKTKVLDQRFIRLLEEIDGHQPGHDPERRVDSWNEAIEREQDHKFYEQMGEFADRLKHALRKDGFYNHEFIGHQNRRVNRRKVINR
jgi:predicted nuclease with TOPRIM domain